MDEKLIESLKERLSPEEFDVIVNAGTEKPFTGQYNMHVADGNYTCKACGAVLFSSDSKFESGCGWPSFDRGIDSGQITEHKDSTLGTIRTEVCCAGCGGHLGHVFEDGPTDTGLRYCVNSASIDFEDSQG